MTNCRPIGTTEENSRTRSSTPGKRDSRSISLLSVRNCSASRTCAEPRPRRVADRNGDTRNLVFGTASSWRLVNPANRQRCLASEAVDCEVGTRCSKYGHVRTLIKKKKLPALRKAGDSTAIEASVYHWSYRDKARGKRRQYLSRSQFGHLGKEWSQRARALCSSRWRWVHLATRMSRAVAFESQSEAIVLKREHACWR